MLLPTPVLAALFLFFGYVSAQAFYEYFGVTLSALDLSSTSHALRAANSLPRNARGLVVLPLVLLGFLLAHQLVLRALRRLDRARAWKVALRVCQAGGLALLAGLVLLPRASVRDAFLPLLLAGGALLVEYGLWIGTRFADLPARVEPLVRGSAGLRRGLVAAFVVMAVLWLVTIRAYASGTAQAQLVESRLLFQPTVVVHSQVDLGLTGPGIVVSDAGEGATGYRFSYRGLRPLVHANGHWFLLPVGWTVDGDAAVLMVPDSAGGGLRVDMAPFRPEAVG